MKKTCKSLLTVMMIAAMIATLLSGCSKNAPKKAVVSSVSSSNSSSDAVTTMTESTVTGNSSLASSASSSNSRLSSFTSSAKNNSSKASSSSNVSSTANTSSVAKPEVSLKLATTTSVNDSGLLNYLAPFLKNEENITLDVLAQGSGQAITTATKGDCDVLIAHSPAAEQAFVDNGIGVDRKQFTYNYFAIVGPIADPAKIASATSASAAFSKIYFTYAKNPACIFYSRDDKSGTDTKEKSIWTGNGMDATTFSSDFYKKTGTGMLATLTMADNTDGYTLTDKPTFIVNQSKLSHLKLLFEKNDELKNVYSVTLISKDKFPNPKYDDAKRFHDWLLKPSTQQKIADYGKAQYGEALFYVN